MKRIIKTIGITILTLSILVGLNFLLHLIADNSMVLTWILLGVTVFALGLVVYDSLSE